MEKTALRGAVRPVIQTKHYSGDQMKRMRWAGHEAHMGKRRGAYRVLVVKPEGKGLLERPRIRWEENIEWIFKNWNMATEWIRE